MPQWQLPETMIPTAFSGSFFGIRLCMAWMCRRAGWKPQVQGNHRGEDLRTLTGVMIFDMPDLLFRNLPPKKNLRAHCPGAPARSEAYLERDEVTGAQMGMGPDSLWDLDNKTTKRCDLNRQKYCLNHQKWKSNHQKWRNEPSKWDGT